MSDFSTRKGGTQAPGTNARTEKSSGVPKTGFSQAPKGGKGEVGPGPGIGNSRKGIC